jgi:hypothetical protein
VERGCQLAQPHGVDCGEVAGAMLDRFCHRID